MVKPSSSEGAAAPDPEAMTPISVGREDDSDGKRSQLPKWRRYVILFIVSWNCFVVITTSTSVLIATPEISAELSTTPAIINVTNSGVLLAMGLSPMIWAPLSDMFSRRIAYSLTIAFLFITSIGTAVSHNFATFTAMRLLTGLTGAYFMVSGQTIIADIFKPLVRGRAVGCMMVGSVAGGALGPCIGGIIITFSSWRSVYWLQTAQSGLGLILTLCFIPDIRSTVAQRRFSPLRVFTLFMRPQVILADLTCGFLALTQYGLLSSVRHIINPRFHLTTPLIGGLFYLSPAAGFVVGSLVGGRFSDRTAKQYLAKRGGVRLPKDRLNSGLVQFFIVLPVSILLYGWCLDKQFGGLALPIVMAFWVGMGLMGAFNGLNTYTAEVLPDLRAEVVCSKYIIQYVFGAAATACIIPMIDKVGVGYAFTIFGIMKIFGGLMVLLLARFARDKGLWASWLA
ncbi:related to MFS transporter [Cephalotrichum gorgonifer]|uniref:Related to MFS transporter n=1 Tax=Cephalotrichum gorgonifer TaxID=2041049 RepID=A0AAE8SSY4_9PEZI|nr:related to MFS transporter [Cephalotrichum gorgonifer]